MTARSMHAPAVMLFVCLLAASGACRAGPFPLPGYHLVGVLGPIGPVTYDADNDLFTDSTTGERQALCGVSWCIDDIEGIANLTAQIDASGVTQGGSFTWIGTSPSLAISTPTILMSARVLLVELRATPFPDFATLAAIDFLAPQVAAFVGPIRSVQIGTYASIEPLDPFCATWNGLVCGQPWQADTEFHRHGQTGIWGSLSAITEPAPFALLLIALAALGVTHGRYSRPRC